MCISIKEEYDGVYIYYAIEGLENKKVLPQYPHQPMSFDLTIAHLLSLISAHVQQIIE